jgi:competence protein ComGC
MKQQRGMTMIGMLLIAIIVAFFGLVTIKVVPTVLEYQSILKAVKKAGTEGGSVAEVKTIYGKAMEIDQIISSVKVPDLVIEPDGNGRFDVSFAYNKEIPLFANAYLLLKYEGSSKRDGAQAVPKGI